MNHDDVLIALVPHDLLARRREFRNGSKVGSDRIVKKAVAVGIDDDKPRALPVGVNSLDTTVMAKLRPGEHSPFGEVKEFHRSCVRAVNEELVRESNRGGSLDVGPIIVAVRERFPLWASSLDGLNQMKGYLTIGEHRSKLVVQANLLHSSQVLLLANFVSLIWQASIIQNSVVHPNRNVTRPQGIESRLDVDSHGQRPRAGYSVNNADLAKARKVSHIGVVVGKYHWHLGEEVVHVTRPCRYGKYGPIG
mmetsp:Transcript_21595/g.45073  ORF Transcript_21595/g.45073 Transcript_21595/m.45073 type:complete len:250 (-) Transcript_21595:982-1731(-)